MIIEMNNKIYIDWFTIEVAAKMLATELKNKHDLNKIAVLAPHYGGWPVATMVINKIRTIIDDENYKPPVFTESDLVRGLLVPLLTNKTLVIFDDVLDTGRVINNIIWRIIHECSAFIDEKEILKKIVICTVGKKRDCEWDCTHYSQYTWPQDRWIVYPWE